MRFRVLISFIGLSLLSVGNPSLVLAADVKQGLGFAIDGQTVVVDGVRLQLAAIDAPKLNQWCEQDQIPYPCGSRAQLHLSSIAAYSALTCTIVGSATAQPLATCSTDTVKDLGGEMVRDGWAVPANTSDAYAAELREARAARRGIWAGEALDGTNAPRRN